MKLLSKVKSLILFILGVLLLPFVLIDFFVYVLNKYFFKFFSHVKEDK